jgi:hypothetical protein
MRPFKEVNDERLRTNKYTRMLQRELVRCKVVFWKPLFCLLPIEIDCQCVECYEDNERVRNCTADMYTDNL